MTRRVMSSIQCLEEKASLAQIQPRRLLMDGHTLTWSSLGMQPGGGEGWWGGEGGERGGGGEGGGDEVAREVVPALHIYVYTN